MHYYFDDIMRISVTEFYKILLDEKSYENIFDILYKTFMVEKPLLHCQA